MASLAALYVTVMILATQRCDDELASHRDQLTLELAILADRKSAKIIELLEELRRDMPAVRDRIDHEATSMSTPADPQAVLDAIQDSHDELQSGFTGAQSAKCGSMEVAAKSPSEKSRSGNSS